MDLIWSLELLEIEHRARCMVGEQKGLELIQEMTPKLRIGEHRADAYRIDLPSGEILHDRQDQRPVSSGVDHRAAIPIGKNGELVIWTGHRHPHRRKPVEVADVPLERSG